MTQHPNRPEGMRKGFLTTIACIAVVLGASLGYLKFKQAMPAAPDPAPPSDIPTAPPVAETDDTTPAPPAIHYTRRIIRRDFTRRRGAPRLAQQTEAQTTAMSAPIVLVKTNEPPAPPLEEVYGIKMRGVRMSIGASYLDLRYKVLDANKAARLASGTTSSFLQDSASGAMLLMPKPPAEGAFPPTGNRLISGRTYFALVPNPDRMIKSGSQVVFHVDGAGPIKMVVQ